MAFILNVDTLIKFNFDIRFNSNSLRDMQLNMQNSY